MDLLMGLWVFCWAGAIVGSGATFIAGMDSHLKWTWTFGWFIFTMICIFFLGALSPLYLH